MTDILPVPWHRTALWPGNPRRHIDEASQRELTESVRRKGILQNLVARPLDPANRRRCGGNSAAEYEIVFGQRRWRAVERLVREGAAPPDTPLPLRVAPLDDREALLLAVAENLQRRDMDPWEEAEAFGRLLDAGETVYSLAERLGVSARLIKNRRALLGLVPEAMAALKEGRINLGQAGAFSVGAREQQRALLDAVLDRPDYPPARIRDKMVGEAVPLEWALFDPALYRGEVVPDLFSERSYAADRDGFRALQRQAVADTVTALRRKWAWAEAQWGGFFAPWDYEPDGSPETAGAIVHLRDDLRVEIHTGLVRRVPVSPASGSPREGTPCDPKGPWGSRGLSRGAGPRPVAAEHSDGATAAPSAAAAPFSPAACKRADGSFPAARANPEPGVFLLTAADPLAPFLVSIWSSVRCGDLEAARVKFETMLTRLGPRFAAAPDVVAAEAAIDCAMAMFRAQERR